MSDEFEIRPVIGDIAENDQACVQRKGSDQSDLGDANGERRIVSSTSPLLSERTQVLDSNC